MHTFIGQKQDQSQMFLTDGTRIPVTRILVRALPVIAHKMREKTGYFALQVGLLQSKKKRGEKEKTPRFLREIRLTEQEAESMPNIGDVIKASDLLKPGDIIDVTGTSKGKGYAGVVKRHHFKGGPRTHGQSDRERAPGSIGQTTTPGRVYKGKRMAGRMGGLNATIKNLQVIDINEDTMYIKGLVPGIKNSLVTIRKVGENKKFVPAYKEPEVSKAEKASKVSKGEKETEHKKHATTEDIVQNTEITENEPTSSVITRKEGQDAK